LDRFIREQMAAQAQPFTLKNQALETLAG
jgi:hypothetical protein